MNHNSEPADRAVDWFSLPSATSFDRDIFPVNQTNDGAGGGGGGGKSKLFPFVSLLAVATLVSPSLLQLSRLLLLSPLFSLFLSLVFFSFLLRARSRKLKYLTESELFRSLHEVRNETVEIRHRRFVGRLAVRLGGLKFHVYEHEKWIPRPSWRWCFNLYLRLKTWRTRDR